MINVASPEYQQTLRGFKPYLVDPEHYRKIAEALEECHGATHFDFIGANPVVDDHIFLGLKIRPGALPEQLAREMQVFEYFHQLGLPVPYASLVATDGTNYGILTEDIGMGGVLKVDDVIGQGCIPDTLDNKDELDEVFSETGILLSQNPLIVDCSWGKSLSLACLRDGTATGRLCYTDLYDVFFADEAEAEIQQEAEKYLREPFLINV